MHAVISSHCKRFLSLKDNITKTTLLFSDYDQLPKGTTCNEKFTRWF